MAAVIIFGFLLAAMVIVWALVVAATGRLTIWLRRLYFAFFGVANIAAYFTTFHYIYFANANTRFHGWPVPTVIFQRDGPDAPWLDFVGPTILLAYPMNLTLFAIIPSIVAVVLARRINNRPNSPDTGG